MHKSNKWKLRKRLQALFKQNYECFWCGVLLNEGCATSDHLLPKSKGGGYGNGNIVASCIRCNRRRKNKSVEQWINLL